MKDLIKKLKMKGVDEEKITDINCEAWWALKNSNPTKYNELKDKMEDLYYYFTDEQAEKIVRDMKPFGQVWSKAEIDNFLRDKGIESNNCWYLVMNMARNDYYNTAKALGKQDDAEFYYLIAKDFIADPDAPHHKVGKYFMKD